MNKQEPILKVENLSVGYGDHAVLRRVSFELQAGESAVIVGQNGSGKSTLLKTINGLLPRSEGEIWSQGRCSYLLQGGLIIPDLTVGQHLQLALMHNGSSSNRRGASRRASNKDRCESIFARFPVLKELHRQRAGNLSGGQKQVLSLGLLLAQDTGFWILDEPTAGLSPEMVQITVEFLAQKNKEDGVTLLVVEHNTEAAFQLASSVMAIKDGVLTRKFAGPEFLAGDFMERIVYN